ncbi:hypothetical protein [uncultured Aquimarina sp.]|nr:hypothetical protein [uncultured Aquimarina sp.]
MKYFTFKIGDVIFTGALIGIGVIKSEDAFYWFCRRAMNFQ